MIEAKNAPVENIANAIDTLAASIAAKNVIQCKAIKIPAIVYFIRYLGFIFRCILLNLMYNSIKIDAIVILNQTNGTAFIEISSPKIAVKPAMNTKRCKCR
ncbi:hypothetical protein MHTCC0001_29070 [Flavobacteriaceae bacterium MHTCC 0001]